MVGIQVTGNCGMSWVPMDRGFPNFSFGWHYFLVETLVWGWKFGCLAHYFNAWLANGVVLCLHNVKCAVLV